MDLRLPESGKWMWMSKQSDIRVRHPADGSAGDVLAAGTAGAVLSGVPSTAVTLLRRREPARRRDRRRGDPAARRAAHGCRSSRRPSPCTSRCRSGGRRCCARAAPPGDRARGRRRRARDRGARPRAGRPRVPARSARCRRAGSGPTTSRTAWRSASSCAGGGSAAATQARADRLGHASGASTGTKCPTPSSIRSSASAKNSSMRSDHAGGNSGSCSGHNTVVGTATRSSGAGGALGERSRDGPGAGAVPRDARAERPRPGVELGERVEALGLRRPAPARSSGSRSARGRRARRARRRRRASRRAGAVERLVPELPLRVGLEDALADARQRRGEHEAAQVVGQAPRDRLRDAAADVVAGEDGRSSASSSIRPQTLSACASAEYASAAGGRGGPSRRSRAGRARRRRRGRAAAPRPRAGPSARPASRAGGRPAGRSRRGRTRG